MDISDLISLGRLGTVVRNKDLFGFRPNDSFLPAVFAETSDVFLVFDKHIVFFVTLTHYEQQGKLYLLQFAEEGIAEALAVARKAELMIPLSEYAAISGAEAEEYDPIGMIAMFNGHRIGTVEDYISNPGQRVLIIVTPEEKEILVPDVDVYVEQVDEAKGILYFQDIQELMEL